MLTHVEPGVTRVEADEVTYPLHIVIRHRCEIAMLDGTLDPADLPDAFDDAMVALLGIRPGNPREGCLQDPHWTLVEGWGLLPRPTRWEHSWLHSWPRPCGLSCPISTVISRWGDFAPLARWLRTNVHSRGCFDPVDGRAAGACNRPAPLDTGSFLRHLERRYLSGRS